MRSIPVSVPSFDHCPLTTAFNGEGSPIINSAQSHDTCPTFTYQHKVYPKSGRASWCYIKSAICRDRLFEDFYHASGIFGVERGREVIASWSNLHVTNLIWLLMAPIGLS